MSETALVTHITLLDQSYLVDEGGKAVVKRFHLVFFLSAHHLEVGVDLQVEGSQQAFVDRDVSYGGTQVGAAGAEAG